MIAPHRLLSRLSLSVKIVGSIAVVVLLVVSVIGYYSVSRVQSALEAVYIEKSRTTARLLDAGIRNQSDVENSGELFDFLQRHLWLEPDIRNIDLNLVGSGGLYVAVSTDSNRTGISADAKNLHAYREDVLAQEFLAGEGSRILRLITPIHIARRQIGTFQLDMSLDKVDKEVLATLSSLIAGYVAIVTSVIILGFLLLRRTVLKPLKSLERGMRTMSDGDPGQPLEVTSGDELGRLAQAFNRMRGDLRKSSEKIEHLAFHDALTGLPNRRVLQDRLELELARCRREKREGALLYVDIDHFKDINDSLGHNMGDRLLRQISLRLQEHLRASDSVSRFGGDEFVLLLGEIDGDVRAEAVVVAEKLLSQIAEEYRFGDQTIHITASIGFCLFPQYGDNTDTIIYNADTALYHSKSSGRNRVSAFERSMELKLQSQSVLRRELKKGIERKQFFLEYQAQCDSGRRLIGVEALIRWRHPQRGLLMPDEFIPIAEESDLICRIGEWVLHQACLEFSRWMREEGLDDRVTLSVNVSPRQFHSPGFVDGVQQIPGATRMDLNRLELEVTEGTLLVDSDGVIRKMHELSNLGVKFSLDDFGTGYSSLSYLKRLPVSSLKIDRSFVEDVCNSDDDAAIVETILNMAHQYGLGVVVEGVETEEQRKFFSIRGCQIYQGNLFNRPMNADKFVRNQLNSGAGVVTSESL